MEFEQAKLEVQRLTHKLHAKELELEKVQKRARDAEFILETILESTMAGYWDWYIQKNDEYLSPTFKKMLGYEEHELENSPEAWQKLIHPEDLAKVLKKFEKHVQSKGDLPCDNTVRFSHKNGSTVWIYCRGKVVEWDAQGQPVRMMGSHVDITKLKETEFELNQKNEELLDFAHTISHDLKEPLRGITNLSNLALKRYEQQLGEKGQHTLHTVQKLANRMEKQINMLLHYASIGKTVLTLTQIDLQKTLHSVLDTLHPHIEEEQATISVPKPLPTVRCDGLRLKEVFSNLITNALKYNNSPEKQVEIGFIERPQGKPTVFYVKDNGIGIKEKHQKLVFDVFKRLHHRDKYGGGTGVGLSIVQKIIECHSGNIWVESTFGKGSTFFFTLQEDKEHAHELTPQKSHPHC